MANNLSPEALEARRAYMREYMKSYTKRGYVKEKAREYQRNYRATHPDRDKAYKNSYWERKAANQAESADPAAEGAEK